MRLVLLGGPGAGKGTQAKALAQHWHIVHISTGDLFRYHRDHGTELGVLANQYMAQGQLVPDEVTQKMVEDRIGQSDVAAQGGFVLDGFPRTVPQAQALSGMLASQHQQLDAVLYISVPEEILEERLVGRRVCPQCQANYHVTFHPPQVVDTCDVCGTALIQREDDRPHTVQTRFRVYQEQTSPLIAFYEKLGLLRTVDGSQPPEKVTRALAAAVGTVADD
ncbi:MAG: adenylate kinase [Firmicutes bacterium]|nr:adenylate kinase [Bacillota bacterium]